MSKSTNQKRQVSSLFMIPVILMTGFVPLIVHTFRYQSGLSAFDWFPNASDSQVDVFFAWKMIAAIAIGVVMLGILLLHYFNRKERFRFENAFYLLFFYGLFVAMSALFSPYKHWVSAGIYELFESVWALFAYLILCYYTYQYVQNEKNLVTAIRWSGVGMLIVTLIGVFQYYGKDFFKTSLGKHLITGPEFWDRLDTISFVMGERTSYTTLYNPNFLSFYFGMLIPLSVCLCIASRKFYQRILMAAVAVLSSICMVGSRSDSGWLALSAAVIVVVLILLSRTKRTGFIGIGMAVVGIASLAWMFTHTELGTRLSTTILGTYHMDETFVLRHVDPGTDCVTLNLNGNKIRLGYTINEADGQSVLACTDENGTPLARTLVDEANMIDQLDDPIYGGCQIQPIILDEMPGIRVIVQGGVWDFVYAHENGYYYANSAGKLTKDMADELVSLFRDNAMSGRGHIWNYTIPLLGKHIFVGVGANAYMLAYPQNDYIYHTYVSGANNYDVKAHCWYLQQWVENGLIGLLLLLGFLGFYLVKSTRIYRRANLKESLTWVGIGFFVAVLVYVIAAVANDSNVCTAPVFWGFLGLGMAVNRMVVERGNLFAKADENGESAENDKKADAGRASSSASAAQTSSSAPAAQASSTAAAPDSSSAAAAQNSSSAAAASVSETAGKEADSAAAAPKTAPASAAGGSGRKKSGRKKARGKR